MAASGVAGGLLWRSHSSRPRMPTEAPGTAGSVGTMPYRTFGRTGLRVSELAFGAWGIGGNSYGAVEKSDSLAALARAEELGCNLVDTAAVYGDSEAILGEFLAGRRANWVVATKYSGQEGGMTATLEAQLKRLGTDYIDFYMLHWLPRGDESGLLDELARLKQSGKVRYTGVSLHSALDIDHVIDKTELDGIMVRVSLLDPYPLLARRERLASSGLGVLARSVLKEGFLVGRFTRDTRFTDPNDQRSTWTEEEIVRAVEQVEQFRFLEQDAGTLARAAIGYPLSFPEVSSVVVGVKNVWEAEENFGRTAGYRLSPEVLDKVLMLQSEMGLKIGPSIKETIRGLIS